MYEVFIDNKLIVFSEFNKNVKKLSNFVEIQTDNLAEIDVLSLRASLSSAITLVILTSTIEKDFKRVFKNYQKIEAAGGIVKRKNDYLFIERNGVWDLPKGKVEVNESVEEAAVREIEEECGIEKPIIHRFLGCTFHTYEFKGKHVLKKNWWFMLDYTGSKKATPQVEEGISQVVWFKKKQWQQINENTYPSIIKVLAMAKKKNQKNKFA
uniref:NUDIX hydrolase n=1 Tax=Fluviicola sp. TaxID=1917219 RepID=UPI0040497EF7